MTTRSTTTCARATRTLIGVLAVGALTPAATAQPDRRPTVHRVLIDRSLARTSLVVVEIGHGTVKVLDPGAAPGSEPREIPLDSLLAITAGPDFAGGARPSPVDFGSPYPLWRIETVDGQRLIGRLAEPTPGHAPPKDAIVFVIPTLGPEPIALRLDDLRAVSAAEGLRTAPPEPGPDDTVILTNGDVIEGFVESLGAEIEISPKGGAERLRVPASRVRAIGFTNASRPPSGPMLWLADGSVVGLRGESLARGSLHDAAPVLGGVLKFNPGEFQALAPHAEWVRPLAAQAPEAFAPESERRWTRPPIIEDPDAPLGLSEIELPGPMSADWAIPPDAAGLAGELALVKSAQAWGDCVVRIEQLSGDAAPARLFEQRLHAEKPSANFEVGFTPAGSGERRVRFVVEAGERGPIQDRVVIRAALFKVAPGN